MWNILQIKTKMMKVVNLVMNIMKTVKVLLVTMDVLDYDVHFVHIYIMKIGPPNHMSIHVKLPPFRHRS